MNETEKHYFDANKTLWNERTDLHVESEFYDMKGFESGKSSLNKIELDILGNIKGEKILHLQCHFGQDTLSLTRMGARVTGLDFSDKAIHKARQISEKLDIKADFVCCNVLEMDQHITEQFDVVFASYGICGWLPQLDKWATLTAQRLKPGGRFILVDFHPFVWMFNNNFEKIQYSYFNKEVIIEEEEGTYADRGAAIKEKSYGWNHSLSEITSVLLKAGLSLTLFNEYDYSPYPCFNNIVKSDEGYQLKGMEGKMPMVYGIEVTKLKS